MYSVNTHPIKTECDKNASINKYTKNTGCDKIHQINKHANIKDCVRIHSTNKQYTVCILTHSAYKNLNNTEWICYTDKHLSNTE